ncbi:hypothetical protein PBY51_001510 [Eleginops maclovinus]|uniref:Uncharacterized protein n=1 Tax=Eleginops maclovinus TaxID=56733 RepID=A0AAN7WP49_ELEMC|nr:hypothetical protein PBY51_001510 [Eleginops maclovinus]
MEPHLKTHGGNDKEAIEEPDLAQTYQTAARPQGTAPQWLEMHSSSAIYWCWDKKTMWVSWARGQLRINPRRCAQEKAPVGHKLTQPDLYQSGDDSQFHI